MSPNNTDNQGKKRETYGGNSGKGTWMKGIREKKIRGIYAFDDIPSLFVNHIPQMSFPSSYPVVQRLLLL